MLKSKLRIKAEIYIGRFLLLCIIAVASCLVGLTGYFGWVLPSEFGNIPVDYHTAKILGVLSGGGFFIFEFWNITGPKYWIKEKDEDNIH